MHADELQNDWQCLLDAEAVCKKGRLPKAQPKSVGDRVLGQSASLQTSVHDFKAEWLACCCGGGASDVQGCL